MKKIVFLFLMSLPAFAQSGDKAVSVAGNWSMCKYNCGSGEIAMPQCLVYRLNSNGTGTVTQAGTETTLTWKTAGEVVELTYSVKSKTGEPTPTKQKYRILKNNGAEAELIDDTSKCSYKLTAVK